MPSRAVPSRAVPSRDGPRKAVLRVREEVGKAVVGQERVIFDRADVVVAAGLVAVVAVIRHPVVGRSGNRSR